MANTNWQAGADKPSSPGVYLRDFRSAPTPAVLTDLYCKWDGQSWGAGRHDPQDALECGIPSQFQGLPWRDVAHAPV